MASSTDKNPIVHAAGAVLWRSAPDSAQREFALVHRPRYDDWSFPKGKVENGETAVSAAVREVAEETGFHAVLGRSLGSVEYKLTRPKKNKHVHYWSARAVDGEFVPNDEVDQLRWVPQHDVRALLSYDLDRDVFDRYESGPSITSTAILVRHARAGSKSAWRGDDADRPLDSVGVRQAAALVPLLTAFGGTQAFCADRVRCTSTVHPWATAASAPMRREKLLTEEGYAADTDNARELAVKLARTTGGVPVICSQGKVIPDFVAWWADRDGLALDRTRTRKASVWILSLDEGTLVAADYIDSPLPNLG